MKNTGMSPLAERELKTIQGTGFFFQINSTISDGELNPYPPDVARLLSEFSQIFSPPTSLPPKRSHDHCIPLQPNAEPVSVRPYRYTYYQKSERENGEGVFTIRFDKTQQQSVFLTSSINKKSKWGLAILGRLSSLEQFYN